MDGLLRSVEQPLPSSLKDYIPVRADVVKEATKRVPLNNLGLPEGFHRSDLLPVDVIKRVIPQEQLYQDPSGRSRGDLLQGVLTDEGPLLILDEKRVRLAYVPLDYSEGFPTLPKSGLPFWDKLEFEPIEAHRAFELYLKQGTSEGSRRLFSLACQPQTHQLCLGTTVPNSTNVQNGAEDAQLDLQRDLSIRTNRQLQEWFILFYWGPRARAHDLFYLEGIRQSQRTTALHLQNEHFQDASALYHKIFEFIQGKGDGALTQDPNTGEMVPKFWAQMTPRVLTDFLKVVGHMQRISVGLPGAAPPDASSPSSVVNILRSLTGSDPLTYSGADSDPSSGRGRPRVAYDENNNLLKGPATPGNNHPPRYIAGPNQGQSSGSDVGSGSGLGLGLEDDDRLRRIARIFNSAKARMEANRQLEPEPISDPEPEPEPEPISEPESEPEVE